MRFINGSRPGRGAVLAAAMIVGLTLLAVWGIFELVNGQREFEHARWQARLDVVSSGGARITEELIAEGRSTLDKAATNPTVQIYLAELAAAGFDLSGVDQGQIKKSFVASYVVSLGQRGPFTGDGAGVALIAADGAIVAATPGFSPSLNLLDTARKAATVPLAMVEGAESAFLFAAPVAPIQATAPRMEPVGHFVGLRTLDAPFWTSFTALGGADMTVTLVGGQGEAAARLGPPEAVDTEMASGLGVAAAAPGDLHRAPGSNGEASLLLARAVTGTSFSAVAHVTEANALAGIGERLRSLLLSLMLGLLAAISAMFALSRHVAGTQAAEAARAAKRHAEEIAEREHILRGVADTHPGGLALVGSDDRIVFANSRFAGGAGIAPEETVGRLINDVLPSSVLGVAAAALMRCRAEGQTASGGEATLDSGRILSITAAPLVGAGTVPGGAVLSFDDITEAVDGRNRKIAFHWALTDLLLEAIDQRNAGAAAHSRRVATLAAALAEVLGAGPEEVETTKLAAALFNAGKLFVPSELLTKTGPLTPEERQQITAGSERWLVLLTQISADLPLASVLKEALALTDASSPPGAPEEARREARAIVVANGFVALVSPRSYRAAKSPAEALAELTRSGAMARDAVEALRSLHSTPRTAGVDELSRAIS